MSNPRDRRTGVVLMAFQGCGLLLAGAVLGVVIVLLTWR